MTTRPRLGRTGLAVALLLAAAPQPAARASLPEPVRILLVGDSVTQGSSGDWTWRYRLWQHLVADGVGVDLVGPSDDLYDNVTGQRGSHEYVDPAFDQDHAARWGMQFATQDVPVADLVAEYHPDVVVEGLGLNDLAWRHASVGQVLDEARQLVADARAADPGIDVVLGALSQTWVLGAPEYNAALTRLALELDTDDSRVVTAVPAEPLVEGVDTYDPAHPTASGEVKLAAGVADALAGLGIGSTYPRPLPVVPNGPRVPALLSAAPGDREAVLSWRSPPGATAEYVWVRDTTTGEPWIKLPIPLGGSGWTAGDLVNHDAYEFRLQAEKGSVAAEDVYSNVVTVTPAPPPPGPVSNVTATPTDHGLAVSWDPSSAATEYLVTWWRSDRPDDRTAATVTDCSVAIGPLEAGLPYAVQVQAVEDGTPGTPVSVLATPAGPVPTAPEDLTLRALAGRRVLVRWTPSADATSYQVQRRVDARWRAVGSTSSTRFVTPPIRATSRRTAFRVRAVHQFLLGGLSDVVRIRLGPS